MKILITGSAGFVGGALARSFLRGPGRHSVVLLDNPRRCGTEWKLAGLQAEGAHFVHGDVRRFQRNYPAWAYSYDLRTTLAEMSYAAKERYRNTG